jgi:hypothetical protein
MLRNNEVTEGWKELHHEELHKLQLIFLGEIKRM